MMRPWRLPLTVCLLSSALFAQAPQQPVFRGGVDVIEVDVTVVDDRGRPIADLLAPEFNVRIDGQPRKVVTAQFVSVAPVQTDPRRAKAEKPEVFYSSNAITVPGRLIMIAVDRESISFGEGRNAMRAASKFLETLGPHDKVAFASVPLAGTVVDFTSNHQLVRKELERMAGVAHRPRMRLNLGVQEAFALSQHSDGRMEFTVLARFCGQYPADSQAFQTCELDVQAEATAIVEEVRRQVHESIRSLETILEALRDMEGPKSLVWISEGLMIEGAGGELAGLERLAAAARTTVNVILLDVPLTDTMEFDKSPTAREDRDLQIRGLELLAGMTRGALFRVSQNVEYVFRRMETELSAYYLLGVESVASDRDGKRHAINVSVGRRNVNVRARRQFQVAPDAEAKNRSIEDRLLRTLRSPFAVTELPLRLATYAYQDATGSKVRVLIATEIEQSEKTPTDVMIGYTVVDRDGNVASSGVQRTQIVPVDGPHGPVLEYAGAILVEPGSYTLKLAAIDGSGHRGSIEHPLQAWQMSGLPFAIGDLMLADTPAKASDLVRPPVEARISAGRLAAYLELYATQPDFFASAQVRVEVTTDESSPPLASGSGQMIPTGDAKSWKVSTIVPVDALPPGQYLARAIVMRDTEKIGQLSRPFQITTASAAAGVAATATATVASGALTAAPSALIASMLTPPAAFQRGDLLKSEVIGFFMDLLDKGRPELKATTGQVRSGKLEGTSRQAFDTGDQIAAMFLRGLELFAKGDLDQAATQFASALRAAPDFAPAAFYLGACYAAGGRDQEALSAWRRALLAPQKTPAEYAALGDALLRLGDAQQAITPLREAVATWPNDDQLRRRLAMAYALTLQHGDAFATMEPYIARHPDDHESLLVALHAIYAAHLLGKPLVSVEQDRERMATYGSAYAAAKGPHGTLVATWVAFVNKPRPFR